MFYGELQPPRLIPTFSRPLLSCAKFNSILQSRASRYYKENGRQQIELAAEALTEKSYR
jgi:hypothetical protein